MFCQDDLSYNFSDSQVSSSSNLQVQVSGLPPIQAYGVSTWSTRQRNSNATNVELYLLNSNLYWNLEVGRTGSHWPCFEFGQLPLCQAFLQTA